MPVSATMAIPTHTNMLTPTLHTLEQVTKVTFITASQYSCFNVHLQNLKLTVFSHLPTQGLERAAPLLSASSS